MKKQKKYRTGLELQDAAVKGLPLLQNEIAAVLACSSDTIRRYTDQGMPCWYIGAVQKHARGARPRYSYPECLAWLNQKQVR